MTFIDHIISLALTALATSRSAKMAGLLNAVRKAFTAASIPCNPVGAGNAKTGVPSTYRPVGDTCAASCPYLDAGCYAQHGHVFMAQRRATNDVQASVAAAIAGAAVSLHLKAGPARLHVSGDFGKGQAIDHDYVEAIAYASQALRTAMELGDINTMYTYTHFADLDTKALAAAGVVVLQSDLLQVGGSILADFDSLPGLRAAHPEVRLVKCAAQTTKGKVSCRTCQLCQTAYDKGHAVVFAPHGSKAKAARDAASKLR